MAASVAMATPPTVNTRVGPPRSLNQPASSPLSGAVPIQLYE